jgi:hypothetical protein
MSRFHRPSTGDVIDVPDALDGRYNADPTWLPYDPDAVAFPVDPAALAPAGSTGDVALPFDPEQPLAAGPAVALENIEDIKGDALDKALTDLGLDTKGNATQKRDRLAARLNEEVTDA